MSRVINAALTLGVIEADVWHPGVAHLQLHAGLGRIKGQRHRQAHPQLQHQHGNCDQAQPRRAGTTRPEQQGQASGERNQQQAGEQHGQTGPHHTWSETSSSTIATITVST